jgi:transcriptional regulator with XRE-family HTH domain
MDHDGSPTATTPAEVIAQRLNHLFATIRQPNNRKHTDEQVADHVSTVTGEPCTRQWVADLRKARKRKPELVRLEAIAGFFGVAPRYLFDDEQADAVNQDIQTAQSLKELEVQGLHLRQLQELTPEQVRIVASLINELAAHNRRDEAS